MAGGELINVLNDRHRSRRLKGDPRQRRERSDVGFHWRDCDGLGAGRARSHGLRPVLSGGAQRDRADKTNRGNDDQLGIHDFSIVTDSR
jgi:hypothetical protein